MAPRGTAPALRCMRRGMHTARLGAPKEPMTGAPVMATQQHGGGAPTALAGAGGARLSRRGAAHRALGGAAGAGIIVIRRMARRRCSGVRRAQRSGDRRHPTAAGRRAAMQRRPAAAGTTAWPIRRIRRRAAMHKPDDSGMSIARRSSVSLRMRAQPSLTGRRRCRRRRRAQRATMACAGRTMTVGGIMIAPGHRPDTAPPSAARRGAITQEENSK